MNPANFVVNNINQNQIHVYLICEDKKAAEKIEVLQMTDEDANKYYNLKAFNDKLKSDSDCDRVSSDSSQE